MTRGPRAKSAIDAALPVAWARGFVTMCTRERGSVCDLVVHAATGTFVIAVQLSRRLHAPIAEIEWQYCEQIGRLRLVPQGPNRSLELWVCSLYGVLRFFRVLATGGLVELDKNGEPAGTAAGTGGA